MSRVLLEAVEGSHYSLSGVLDFDSVPTVLPQLSTLLGSSPSEPLILDLAAVESANSAAVALLIECRAIAASSGRHCELRNLPDSIVKIADVCEVSGFLK